MTEATTSEVVVGTVDVPPKIDRERYFRELSYLELSALFAGPLKPSSLAKWTDAPARTIGLVAPFPLTHRKPPAGSKLWAHDATSGDFRASEPGRATLGPLREAIDKLSARAVIFRSPESFSASAANRDQLRTFFSEIATTEVLGDVRRVWLPGGLWEVRSAAKLAEELDVMLAFDPLVREPGEPPEIHHDLDVSGLYLRPEGGRAGLIRNERLEDLAALVEQYEDLDLIVSFASPERWQDARNFRKLLEG